MDSSHPLRAWREKQEPPLTQGDLAAHLGVTTGTVSRWESRKRMPLALDLLRLNRLTGIPIDALIVASAPTTMEPAP